MTSCPNAVALSRFVDGEFTRNEEAALAEHLPACARCRATLDELGAIVADLRAAPGPLDAPDLAAAVLSRAALPPRRRRLLPPVAAGLSIAAALVAGVLIGRQPLPGAPARSVDEAGFQARGAGESPDRWVAIHAFAASATGAPRKLDPGGGALAQDESLLVAYDNGGPAPYSHLLVLAVDGGGHRQWVFPDPAKERASIRIEPGFGRELREAVTLARDGASHDGRFQLLGVFSHAPIRLDEAEEKLAGAPLAERLPLPGTGQHRCRLTLSNGQHD